MAEPTSERMLKWQVGLLATLLGTFIAFVGASIPWAMGVNKELGGIGQSLKNQERFDRDLQSIRAEQAEQRKLIFERLK